MAMQQCPNGHVYDDSKNASCPYCNGAGEIGVTVPLSNSTPYDDPMFPKTTMEAAAPTPAPQVLPKTAPYDNPNYNKTVYVTDAVNSLGISEIRGWLVCTEGAKKGVDFKIHSERNTIGRGEENDINLSFDNSISKGVNAILTYDNRNNKFYISQSTSKNNIYVNNSILLTPVELKDYDVLEIGGTKMIFRSLCNDQFTWDRETE